MKRSVMPIMALVFTFATFVTAVTPASACWWGRATVGVGTTAGNKRPTAQDTLSCVVGFSIYLNGEYFELHARRRCSLWRLRVLAGNARERRFRTPPAGSRLGPEKFKPTPVRPQILRAMLGQKSSPILVPKLAPLNQKAVDFKP